LTREIVEVYQGDLSAIRNARPSIEGLDDVLDANWECYVRVIDRDNNAVVAKREITDKMTDTASKERFVAAILPTETAEILVPTGRNSEDYIWIIQLENSTLTPPWVKEHQITLRVRRQGLE